jgi:predicted nucleic acid-binding protein
LAAQPLTTNRLYADASAVLAWLLDEPRGEEVAAILAGATDVLSSELTLVECDRALLRWASQDRLTEVKREELSERIATAVANWTQLAVTARILLRARLPFASAPVRTLDAIHLASALEGRGAVPGLALLSLDDRMRKAARGLGFVVVPT